MKKFTKVQILAVVLALTAAMTVTVLASSYDSAEDPIISLSYLTEIFRPSILAEYEEKIAGLEEKIDTLSAQLAERPATVPDTKPAEPTEPETTPPVAEPVTVPETYEVVELKYGDCLFAAGPIDIMLRAGKAVCIAPDPTQGISDYTDGAEIYDGQNLTKNHMCLIPRGDGRGIMATAESVFIMVKGDYTLVQS